MKFEDLTMNNLKTKDLPTMMRIVKKLNIKDFIKETTDIVFNEDVPKDVLESLKGKDDEEKEDIIQAFKDKKYTEIVTLLLDSVIDGYDKVHGDLESLVSSVYNLKKKEVQELDLNVMLECIYHLKEQEQLVNFFKTALK